MNETNERDRLQTIAERLAEWALARNFEGFDPYDALNSPFASVLSLGTRFGRIAWTQLLRRSPVNLRPILAIKPGANPKALGLFLEGFVKLGRLDVAETLFRRLLELRAPNASGSAWGYNFPWQNRFQLLPPHTPTIVNSAFIGNAILDYHEASGSDEALRVALTIPDFILNDLRRLETPSGAFCFSYTPLDENYVHNANLLGAAFLARLAVNYGLERAKSPALNALRYSMERRREDGAWYYAERREQRWIDSFHTGFDLEALRRFRRLGLADEYEDAYRKSLAYYAREFFLEDGTPTYYAGRRGLVDIHAPAEALCFFGDEGEKWRELTRRIENWTLENMYDEKKGTFYFRKTPYGTIKLPYMRWCEAWAFRAVTTRLAALR